MVKRAANCPAKLCLACLSTDVAKRYILRTNNEEHVHPESMLASVRISTEVTKLIKDSVKVGNTQMEIRSKIVENGLPVPSENQLKVAIRNEKNCHQ